MALKDKKKVVRVVQNPPLHELNEIHRKQLIARRKKEAKR